MKNKIKKITIVSVLILTITMISNPFVNSEPKQDLISLNQNDSGSISGLSYVYYNLYAYDNRYGISWSFSGISRPIDIWLFDSTNFDKFKIGSTATGYHIYDADDNYISNSGKFQIPDMLSNWYLVYYNPNFLRVDYNDISCSAQEIHAQIDSITYKKTDNDNDGFDDHLEVTFEVSFGTTYWTEGSLAIRGYLYNEDGKEADYQGHNTIKIVNSKTFDFIFEANEKGIYTIEIELYFFSIYEYDDISKSTNSYSLYDEGHLKSIIIKGVGIGVPSILAILVGSIVIRRISKKTKGKKQQVEVLDSPFIQIRHCMDCGFEVKTNSIFCEKCGSKLNKMNHDPPS